MACIAVYCSRELFPIPVTYVYIIYAPADSSSTNLGIGLSIALKAERGIPDWLWGAVAQWSEHLQLKQEALGSIPSGCPGFFFLSAGLY